MIFCLIGTSHRPVVCIVTFGCKPNGDHRLISSLAVDQDTTKQDHGSCGYGELLADCTRGSHAVLDSFIVHICPIQRFVH